ncbi:DASS family divalent anion:Na+ symporter [Mucilaginibacter gracilis]|uniref:DASS family divalent anion:Na+ symporter n=1 Tax=Mucilaginibacter gracilis TaxID=423350 RepID=A0A495IVR1_9SPHI|nr:anion permease [Mucilaginibacter gracilis]RKR80104.1 DASS family divalent anion:Na+ symporter [Mucilaginibacter gracilis]
MKEINLKAFAITLVVGLIIWFIPVPEGVKPNAWHLLAIFVATIVGIILKAAPMGTMAMLGITLCAGTQVLAPGNPVKSITNALSGFGNSTIWLIGLAFFIARGFIKTGLGNRLAYNFIKLFGKSTLGLAYGLNTADLILAPAIPSNTARAGGVIFPIMKSIAVNMGSEPEKPETHRKIGAFLTLSSYNANMITSVMFLTATASNPMAQKFAHDLGVDITWGSWAMAAAIPGLVCFLLVPLFLYKFYPPELKQTKEAPAMAAAKLKEMGKISLQEWLMVATFIVLLVLWIFGNLMSIDATTGALIGLCILLLCGVLSWEDVKAEKGAWDTIVWFSALVMMGSYLNSLGLIGWFGHLVGGSMKQFSWQLAFPLIILVYSYCHYLFASATAQVAAMYSVFLAVGIAVGVPGPMLAIFLGACPTLMGSLTHYGHGPAPIFFGSTYVDMKDWWKQGFFMSVLFLLVWFIVGGLWWKVIGSW